MKLPHEIKQKAWVKRHRTVDIPCFARPIRQIFPRSISVATQAGRSTASSDAKHLYWYWQGYRIRYQAFGPEEGDVVLFLHGFGASSDHWRQNVQAAAAAGLRTLALDLLGYGLSDKPDPRQTKPLVIDSSDPGRFYSIPMWAAQAADFLREVAYIGKNATPAFVVSNSVGGLISLQLAVDYPELIKASMLLNPSLRKKHESKQKWFEKPLVPGLQWTLRETSVGEWFYNALAQPLSVATILRSIYPTYPERVDEELVDLILQPGLESGACQVFLDFISYSAGPLVEDLLPKLGRAQRRAPVWILWGAEDPWEPAAEGQLLYAGQSAVERFQVLEGLGHCPMDEAPHVVNPLISEFVAAYSEN